MNVALSNAKIPKRKIFKGLKRSEGFTIVEILVVISIIGVLSGISFVTYTGVTKRAKHAATTANAAQAGKKLALFNTEKGYYPNKDEFDSDFGDIFGDDNYDYTPYCNGGPCEGGEFPDDYELLVWPDGISDACKQDGDCDDDEIDDVVKTTPDNPSGISMGAPKDCPTGFIPVTGSIQYKQQGFCVMKYEAKESDGGIASVPEGLPITVESYDDAVSLASEACDYCHLMTNTEWMTLVRGIIRQKSNWLSGIVGQGMVYGGHRYGVGAISASADDNGYYGLPSANYGLSLDEMKSRRRTLELPNGEIIWDLSGNVGEMVDFSCSGTGPAFLPKDGDISDYVDPSTWGELRAGSSRIYPNPFPGSMNIEGVSDDRSAIQGLGLVMTDEPSETCTLNLVRGGTYTNFGVGGLLSLYSSSYERDPYITGIIGFRATR